MSTIQEKIQQYSVAIVTGGSSGIGLAYLSILSKITDDLLICNISRSKPQVIDNQGSVMHFECDLADFEALRSTVNKVLKVAVAEKPKGKILLVNNAGYGSYGTFDALDLDNELGIIDLNVRALVQLTGECLPLLKKRGGTIMNVASIVGFQPAPYFATYAASKSFVINWSLAINNELKGSGVSCIAVCPGPTKSMFFKRAGFDKPPTRTNPFIGQTAEEVAQESLEAFAADKRLVVTGWGHKLLTLFTRMLPIHLRTWLTGESLKRYRLKQ